MYKIFSVEMQLVIFKASYSLVDQPLYAFLPVTVLKRDHKVLCSFIIQQSLINQSDKTSQALYNVTTNAS